MSFTVGDRIPADVRLLTAVDLDVDESSLTGEGEVVRKTTDACAPGAPLGERSSMVFMGTLVRNGTQPMARMSHFNYLPDISLFRSRGWHCRFYR